MTLQEKLERLQEAAMTEARTQGNAMIEKYRTALERMNEQRRTEVESQAETRIEAEKVNVKQLISMAFSKAALESKRELGNAQKKFKKELFEEVWEMLQKYMKTEEYRALLITYIQKVSEFASGEEMTIYINPTDADKKAYLEDYTGMTLTVSKEDFVGGVRAVIRGRNILVDYAFKGGLEREYQKFVFKGGAGIG